MRLRAALLAGLLLVGPVQAQSIAELTAAAEAGDVAAQVALGARYKTGDGVLQNSARAVKWYSKAAEAGDARAQHHMGISLITGIGIAQDASAGLVALEAAASSGDPDILYDLGQAYESGASGAPEPARAAQAYAIAAKAGLDDAAVALGVLYQEGSGVEENLPLAIELYKGPAERGHPRALNNLGLIYARGSGVAQDYAIALELLTAAAEAGLPQAMRNLAVIYDNGFGVEVDEDRANALLRLAAQGDATVQFLTDPRLVPIDPALLDSYRQGAAQGDPIAALSYGLVLIASDAPNGATYREAARAFQHAAERGIPAAMANLGLLSFQGRGVLQDFAEGYAWLTLAGSLGQPDAIAARDALSQSMTPDVLNSAEQRAKALWAEIVEGN